jgi:hypothetical protein
MNGKGKRWGGRRGRRMGEERGGGLNGESTQAVRESGGGGARRGREDGGECRRGQRGGMSGKGPREVERKKGGIQG